MPTSFKSPFGRPDKRKPITDREWLSYTLPKKKVGFKTSIEEPAWPERYFDTQENVTYNLLDYLYNSEYLTPENFLSKVENGTLDKITDKNMKDMGWYIRSNLPDYEEKEIKNEKGEKVKEFKIPISIFDTNAANEIARFIGDNPELYHRLVNLPEDNITRIALLTALSNTFNTTPTEETLDPLTNFEREVNEPLVGNELNYSRFLIREALGNLARRGINIIGEDHSPFVKAQPGDVTAHAPMQGLSQQKDPYTRSTYAKLQKQVLSKLQNYDKNPRYFNIMKKWHLSPFGDSMLGVNQFSLTIEQMKQILKDFEQEDRNQQIENSEQFQGYQPKEYTRLA